MMLTSRDLKLNLTPSFRYGGADLGDRTMVRKTDFFCFIPPQPLADVSVSSSVAGRFVSRGGRADEADCSAPR